MASQQDLAEQLLRRADTDAAGARAMLPIDDVADVLVCFHAQQAVEKALKAVLAPAAWSFPLFMTSVVSPSCAGKLAHRYRAIWMVQTC